MPTTATAAEVKMAFRRQALKMHPDVRKAASQEEEARHREEFVRLLECAAILSDPDRRAAYDRSAAPAGRAGAEWNSDYDHPMRHAPRADGRSATSQVPQVAGDCSGIVLRRRTEGARDRA